MTTQKSTKINYLLSKHLPGTICIAPWLENQGISKDLQKHYRKSGWLEKIGTGAFKRPNDPIDWQGGLYTLQFQAELPIHVGAITALTMHGVTHYIRTTQEKIYLFSPPQTLLPLWFKKFDWANPIQHVRTSLLPEKIGLISHELKTFEIKISTPERAIIECLYLTPNELDLVECYQLFEGMTNLRPKYLQDTLQQCNSIKVKRLFLYMANKARHQWLKHLDTGKINLGKGKRSLVKKGIYNAEFQITLPEELVKL